MTSNVDEQTGTDAPGALRCPQCGATSPAGARLCRLCYASLEGAERVEVDQAASRRWIPSIRPPSTLTGWLLLALGLIVALVAAWWLRGWLSGPPPPFPEVASDRSASEPGAAWAMPNGALSGARATDADLAAAEVSWQWEASSRPSTTLVTDGDAIYVGLEEGVLVAVDAASGTEHWRVRVPGLLESAPAAVGDRLFVGFRSGSVAALDAETGDPIWEEQIGVSISTTPVVVDGIVFVAGNGVIAGFDAEDGTEIWLRRLSDSVVSVTPVVDSTTLAVATFDRVLIFSRSNGELLSWVNFAPQYAPLTSIAIADDVIFATADGQLMAIETAMRRPWWDGVRPIWEFFDVVGAAPDVPWRPDVWSTDIGSGVLPAAVSDELVVVAARSGLVRAYSRSTGEVTWERQLEAVSTSPVITPAGVLVAGEEGCALLDLEDGAVAAECPLTGDPLDVIPVRSGTFMLTSDGITAALATLP